MRTAFIDALMKVAEQDRNVWLVTGDLGFSVLEPFAARFPGRFLNAGVAEQNMIGVASGLALSGKTVFVYSIANFPTLRCMEQIRNDVCGHNLSVKIVAVGGGYSYGALGCSHHGVEDIAIMRVLPRMEVAAPADALEAGVITRMFAETPGPAYLRLGKGREPAIHTSVPQLVRGGLVKLVEGHWAAIIGTGAITHCCIEAAAKLTTAGITPSVFSAPWVKPLDKAMLEQIASQYAWIVTVEEGQVSGGLGGAVAEVLSELPEPRARLMRLGVPDAILETACSQDAARRHMGICAESISNAVAAMFESRSTSRRK